MRILETFDTKPEDAYEEAEAFVLHGKPSQLAKKLINKLCEDHPNLENCCAAGIITGMWRKRLPSDIRKAVAGMSLKGTANMKDTLQKADAVWATLQTGSHAAAPVAAVTPADLDTSADAPALQVAAMGGSRARFPPRRQQQ